MARSDEDLLAAAVLAAKGYTQRDIGRMLHRHHTVITRWIGDAEDKGWLAPASTRKLLRKNIPRTLLRDVSDKLDLEPMRRHLKEGLRDLDTLQGKPLLRDLTIVRSPNPDHDPKSWDKRIGSLGDAAAARFVKHLLPSLKKVGVTWGKTMRAFVSSVQSLAPASGGRRRVEFVPLCGQPIFLPEPCPIGLSASALAADLAKCLGNSGAQQIDLSVPGSIPAKFDIHASILRDFLGEVPAYRKVFGCPPESLGLVHELDAIISSCGGTTKDYRGEWMEARISSEEIKREDWSKLVLGDIGGAVFPQKNLDRDQQRKFDGIAQRWLGLSLSHLTRCARASAESGGKRLGVVLIAHGRSKAEVVLHAIHEAQCINELIVDDDLARELISLLG